jgi:hypothetical protein
MDEDDDTKVASDLDDTKLPFDFGRAPAGYGNVDPAHILALAVRMENLAGAMRMMRNEGLTRDEKISDVARSVSGINTKLDGVSGVLNTKIEGVSKELKTLIDSQITEEDKDVMYQLITGHTRKKWLLKTLARYFAWITGCATAVWALHEPITRLVDWIKGFV